MAGSQGQGPGQIHNRNRTGVVIVDDQPIFRGGARAALEADPGLTVLGETAGDVSALDRVVQAQPDAVVVGLNPPAMAGLDALRHLRRRLPQVALVALAMHPDDGLRREAEAAGANAWEAKTLGDEGIREALRAALAAVRPGKGGEGGLRALTSARGARGGGTGRPLLSRRETEILHQVVEGQSNKEIAGVLGISDQTVKNNITSLLRKLGVHDRTQAVIHALRHGWIEPGAGAPGVGVRAGTEVEPVGAD